MPLKLNVGLSQKVGEANYGSRGASVNIEMELESALVSEPTKLQARIRQLFSVVRASLTEELNGTHNGNQPNFENGQYRAQRNGHTNQNGHAESNGHVNATNGRSPVRRATPSQVKALYAIARSQGLQLPHILRERFKLGKPDDLTLQEASQLIDDLKSAEASA